MKTYNKLMSVKEVNTLIESKRVLILAGNETVLKKLSNGNWIGGTIPYFIDTKGGCFSKEEVFVTDITDIVESFKICEYDGSNLTALTTDRYTNGFTWLLIPGFSDIHQKFSIDVYSLSHIYDSPIMGWITGIDLAELGKITPKTVDGLSGTFYENKAIALHAQLPDNKYARLDIINLFEQGDGDSITFKTSGFSSTNCIINGKEKNLADYIKEQKIDTRLPLVADYAGAMINISIQNVDMDKKHVVFYAPVRENVEYKFARPVSDYIKEFNKLIPAETAHVIGSCNCILNYLYSELEGKKTGDLTGPITFGEIAYVLVNQTMVYLSIDDK
jgi:hypothetical protein